MNFFKCIISLLLFIALSNCATCKTSRCVEVGQTCTTNTTLLVCDSSSYCSDDGVCEKLSVLGGPCETNDQCGNTKLGYTLPGTYTCVNFTCSLVGAVSVNGLCSSSADCVSDASGNLPCVAGKCQGRPEGNFCFSSRSTCRYGLYCNSSSVCSPYSKMGELCDASTQTFQLNSCGPGNICSSSSICIPQFSRAAGSPCIASQECDGGNICIEGTCAGRPGTKICNQTSDCPRSQGYYGCYCKQNGTRECFSDLVNEPRCTTEINNLNTCMGKYQCTSIEANEKSCNWENCQQETSCYFQCILGQSMDYFYRTGCYKTYGCASSSTTGSSGDSTTGSSATTTQISIGLIFVLIVVVQILFQ